MIEQPKNTELSTDCRWVCDPGNADASWHKRKERSATFFVDNAEAEMTGCGNVDGNGDASCKDLDNSVHHTMHLAQIQCMRGGQRAVAVQPNQIGIGIPRGIAKMELAGTRPTHSRAPPGAPSPVKLCQTYSRDAFRRRTKPKYRKRY